jgi:hypothetical protein
MENLSQQLRRMEDKIERILIQTTKTNGRVDNLSKKTDDHEELLDTLMADSNKTKGGNKIIWVFLSAVGALALILIGWYLNKI